MKIEKIAKLYHGTDKQFQKFDLKYAKPFKDFGKGFYLTSNLKQAQKWAQNKGERNKVAYIYQYDLKNSLDDDIKVLELLKYNKQWVDFITQSRIYNIENNYDIIYDRMADSRWNNISDILQKYVEKQLSYEEVIDGLKWKDEIANQYCFKSENALKMLQNKKVFTLYWDDYEWKVEW